MNNSFLNNQPESVKKISFAKISRPTSFKMTTSTYTGRMLEKVPFTQLFNSIIIKKKVSSLPKENVSRSLPKGIKGRIMYVVCFLEVNFRYSEKARKN